MDGVLSGSLDQLLPCLRCSFHTLARLTDENSAIESKTRVKQPCSEALFVLSNS